MAGLSVGWPAEEARTSLRASLQTTVHLNNYHDSDLIEQVADYDRGREAIEQTPSEEQRMVEKFGISSEIGLVV